MEIECGEYVRFEDGKIEKVTYQLKEFIDEHISKSENNRVEFLGIIVDHSKNIIDLIKVGDYVNGKEVYSIGTSIGDFPIISYKDGTFDIDTNIKSIVTKEQMASIEYKVEESK